MNESTARLRESCRPTVTRKGSWLSSLTFWRRFDTADVAAGKLSLGQVAAKEKLDAKYRASSAEP